MASACVRAASSVSASTMTRTSGSVPLGRSRTRPLSPRVSEAVATADATVGRGRHRLAIGDVHVHHHLRVAAHHARKLAERRARRGCERQEPHGREQPVPVVAYRRKITWPLCSPPRTNPPRSIASSTYRSPTCVRATSDPVLDHRPLEPDVRHHGRHHRVAGELAGLVQPDGTRRQHLIAVDHVALGVGEERAIGVAVVRDARVGAQPHDLGRHDLGVQRAAAVVDVRPVRRRVDRRRRRPRGAGAGRARPPTRNRSRSQRPRACRRAAPARRRSGAAGSARARRRTAGSARGRALRHRPTALPSAASISSSSASGSFIPSREKNLMPLYAGGLCDALITTPAEAPRSTVM